MVNGFSKVLGVVAVLLLVLLVYLGFPLSPLLATTFVGPIV